MHRIQIIDSHTGGEPTRVVISGGPQLGHGTLAERRSRFSAEFDHFRSAIVNEPRGADPFVGALLCEPREPGCVAGVIFFNNVGTLGMCGHGTIGLMVTLAHLGRIGPGTHRIETPVGVIEATLEGAHRVSLRNVASFRLARQVAVEVEGYGLVHGDIAWGGNWFFLVNDHGQRIAADNIAHLTDCSSRIRAALATHGITGTDGAEIDHIELFGPSDVADSRNFVLCPGLAYDRSPCGTGTSAKLACLAADGKLAAGQTWRQESVIGSVFEGSFEQHDAQLYPRIAGTAHITAESTLLLDPADPFVWGIRL
ncbi:proline racemase family protein [Chitinimonas naiadis]